jgi:hypothetical protein
MAPRAAAFSSYLIRYLCARKREALLLRHVTERAQWRHALSQNVSRALSCTSTQMFSWATMLCRVWGSTSQGEVSRYIGERHKLDMSCTEAFATNKFNLGQDRSTSTDRSQHAPRETGLLRLRRQFKWEKFFNHFSGKAEIEGRSNSENLMSYIFMKT